MERTRNVNRRRDGRTDWLREGMTYYIPSDDGRIKIYIIAIFFYRKYNEQGIKRLRCSKLTIIIWYEKEFLKRLLFLNLSKLTTAKYRFQVFPPFSQREATFVTSCLHHRVAWPSALERKNSLLWGANSVLVYFGGVIDRKAKLLPWVVSTHIKIISVTIMSHITKCLPFKWGLGVGNTPWAFPLITENKKSPDSSVD